MGDRGPKPRPTHLKVISGERESRINRDEPIPTEGRIRKPEDMSEGASAVWDELADDLIDKGCLTPWDIYLFEVFCEAVHSFRENRDLLRTEGYTARGSHGGVIKSPHHQIMRDNQQTMAQIGSRFGFTPGDRAGLEIKGADDGPVHGAERLLS